MILNYFKIGIRNLFKRKGYSALNIIGLVTGMTCCLLIFHYVSYERSYDMNIEDAQQIYRIRLDSYQNGELAYHSATSYPGVPPLLKKDLPEIEEYCRLIDANMLLSNEERTNKFNETKGYYAEQTFVQMFELPFAQGNNLNALKGPNKMVISEKFAKKYFGTEKALGKHLLANDGEIPRSYEITGVFKEFPSNSHLTIDYLASYDTFKLLLKETGDTTNSAETAIGWYDFYCYVKLKPLTDIKKLNTKLPAFCDKHLRWPGRSDSYDRIELTPLTDIHLYSNFNQEAEVNGNGQMVSFLFLIAIFIIFIAWVNYVNLSTARSVERAREVGVKKVLGAFRLDLIKQFLVENIILNSASLILSLAIFFFLLKPFDSFSGRETYVNVTLSSSYWWIFIFLFIFGTILSGFYPALVLSGFQPIKVLKGAFKNTTGGLMLRKTLIVTQFMITVVLIAGTIIVYQQVQFMRKQNLGADIEQTLVLTASTTISDSAYKDIMQPFKADLLSMPNIKHVTASSNVMGQEIYWTTGVRKLNGPKESGMTMYNLGIDYDFIPAYKMELKAGRNFSREFGTDKKAAILNEKGAKMLGYKNPQAAIGEKLRRNRDTLSIVGVVADYHHQGLQKMIDPMIILLTPNLRRHYSIKYSSDDPSGVLTHIEKQWNKYFPNDPFNYFFLDDNYNQQYKADILFGKVFSIFAFIAIIIACLGLLGLSAYNVLQRNKEIGVRKVLGASANSILILLSKDFIKLIVISLLISVPFGWYIMDHWLQDFAYRIHIQWWVFVLAGVSAFLVAVVTIILQAFKAVIENPVKSLRTE
jgi:putative ABC transport system permease protein